MVSSPTPVFEERAFLLPEGPSLVVGDLHVGLEGELRRGGIHLPSQTFRMKLRLQKLIRETGARRLIIIGDLKHTIPTSSFQEALELVEFFEDLTPEVDLVKGNHDVDLGYLPSVVRIRDPQGIRVGDVGLLHGHTWPAAEVMEAPIVLTCHNHPMVLLQDELGHRHKEPAWVRTRFAEGIRERYPGAHPDGRFLVMPAFNELLGGVAFNAVEGRDLLGPILSNDLADVEGARLYTLDGVDLGTVRDLRRFGDEATRPRKPSPRAARAAASGTRELHEGSFRKPARRPRKRTREGRGDG